MEIKVRKLVNDYAIDQYISIEELWNELKKLDNKEQEKIDELTKDMHNGGMDDYGSFGK